MYQPIVMSPNKMAIVALTESAKQKALSLFALAVPVMTLFWVQSLKLL